MKYLNYLALLLVITLVISCSEDFESYENENDLQEVEEKILSESTLYASRDATSFKDLFSADPASFANIPSSVLSSVEVNFPGAKISDIKAYNSIHGEPYRHYSVFMNNGYEAVVFQWGHLLTQATIEKVTSEGEILAGDLPFRALLRLHTSFPTLKVEEVTTLTKDLYEIDFKGGERVILDKSGISKSRGSDDNGDDDDDGTHINPNSLPQSILTYITNNYPDATIQEAEVYANGYEVELNNGIKLEFDLAGNFVEISGSSRDNSNNSDDGGEGESEDIDPSRLPQAAKDYIAVNYPGATVIKAEEYPSGYEATLSNGVKLEFDSNGNFIEISGNSGDDSNGDDDDININPSELPQVILDYITANYPTLTIVKAEIDSDGYDVTLSNGIKLEFHPNGDFDEISGGGRDDDDDDNGEGNGEDIDPSRLPQAARDYIATNYPGTSIIKAEEYPSGYEATLSNGVKLEFDSNGNFTEISGSGGDDDDSNSNSGNEINPSTLPSNILAFISNVCPDETITKAEYYAPQDLFEVTLSNGIRMEFDGDGSFVDISGTNCDEISLSSLPSNIATYIQNNFDSGLDKAKACNYGYRVDLRNDTRIFFKTDGTLIYVLENE